MGKFKNDFETVYDENVVEIVVGARRWHEHGKKYSSGMTREIQEELLIRM